MMQNLVIPPMFEYKFVHSKIWGIKSMACFLGIHQRLSPLTQLRLKTYRRLLFDHIAVRHINLPKRDIIMALYGANSQGLIG